MSIVTLYAVFSRKSVSLTQRLAIKDSINHYSLANVVKTFLRILTVTIIVEGIGAVLIAIVLVPQYGWGGGIWRSVFHSISAFCNAGFDLFGTTDNQYTSLSTYQTNGLMLLVTCALIIIGGIGFMVWQDISEKRKFSKFSLHTKIILIMTLLLIMIGTAGFFLFEYAGNTHGLPWLYRIMNSFFNSVTARTAGFNTTSMDKMTDSSNLLSILLMFIGAAPGSTAGGIKVTTFYVLIVAVQSFIRGRSDVYAFRWRISMDIVVKSLAILLLGSSIIILAALIIISSGAVGFKQALFETTSAFGTVGLSMGITPTLPATSKIVLVIVMFLGRTGPITAVMAFSVIQERAKVSYRYPEGKITVG
ncbi:MAG: potassium transporter TrkG [Bacillota bacterium]|nr:potassium transporter TrkG [Bacillota bacterium]